VKVRYLHEAIAIARLSSREGRKLATRERGRRNTSKAGCSEKLNRRKCEVEKRKEPHQKVVK
jgi:hypothetical protein